MLITRRSNPHPVRRLGAILVLKIVQSTIVPILTQSEDWALSDPRVDRPTHEEFQSSPSPKTGRYPSSCKFFDHVRNVPILTQSEDWALFKALGFGVVRDMFQSSPSPKTGRYDMVVMDCAGECEVPILTQSEDWALYFAPVNQQPETVVPILTQSEDWALSDDPNWNVEAEQWFQSSPSPKTGRYRRSPNHPYNSTAFQSSPSPKTGRYFNIGDLNNLSFVPILTQSEDWALSCVVSSLQNSYLLFQSSPSPKTGRYTWRHISQSTPPRFQSSPSPKTGRYNGLYAGVTHPFFGSNPHPVRRLGAMLTA